MASKPDEQLRGAPESQINISLAQVLNARLDALVALAEAAGENTSRKEIISALLLDAPEDGAALAERLRRYRQALQGDAFVAGVDSKLFLDPGHRQPGPRRRRPDT